MSTGAKVGVAGVIIGLILLITGVIPWWVPALLIVAAVAIPVAGYLMLDPSQRRKVRNMSRKQLR